MALRNKTGVIALVGAAIVATLVLIITRDRLAMKNQISRMNSFEVNTDHSFVNSENESQDTDRREKQQTMEESVHSRNLDKNPQTEVLEQTVKNMEKALQTMKMEMHEKEVESKREVEALRNQLNDARASGKGTTWGKTQSTYSMRHGDGYCVIPDAERQGSFTNYKVVASLVSLEVVYYLWCPVKPGQVTWNSFWGQLPMNGISFHYVDTDGYFSRTRDWEKPPEYTCGKVVMKGNWHICNDSKFEVKPPCLVYSFGIWNDWSFDDAMGAFGCEVHSFDPSIGLKPFDRSKNVHFHDLGLSGNDSDMYVPTKDIYVKKTTTWKIRRLKTIMEMLGHTNRHLDVLKIDIETSEWPAVKDIVESGLFSNVRQFSVEWHLFPEYPSRPEFIGFYANVMAMKEQGLRTFRSSFHTKDYSDKNFRVQADVNYVNTLYKGI